MAAAPGVQKADVICFKAGLLLFPLSITVPEGCPLLHNKAVCGYVLRLQHGHLPERVLPALQRLPRNAAHQVHIHVSEPGHAGALVALQEFLKGMDSPQVLKFLVVRGLEANAQPVDSRRAVDMKLVLKQGAGIDLNGNLGICRYVEIPVQSLHDIPDKTRFHNRRSASSNEHGLDLVFTAAGTLDFYFPD